jgi:hypothetical protein
VQTATKLKCNAFQKVAQLSWGWLYEVDCIKDTWKTDIIVNWLYENILDCEEVNKVVTCYLDDHIRRASTPEICTNRVTVNTCSIVITDTSSTSTLCKSVLVIKQL